MTFDQLPPALTVAQTAAFLRIDSDDIVEAIAVGEIAVVFIDGKTFVDTAQLLADLGLEVSGHGMPDGVRSTRKARNETACVCPSPEPIAGAVVSSSSDSD